MDRSPLVTAVDDFVKASLTEPRYAHSLGTAELAGALCVRFGAEAQKGYVAGLAHDAAREAAAREILELCAFDGFPISPAEREEPILLHGRAAAVLLRLHTGYSDPEVREAVRDHVTGRPSMGVLSKIVFAADFLEPGRDFLPPRYRESVLALDLDPMVLAVLERKIQYVRALSKTVLPASLMLFEELKRNAR